jgi:hypothetical protein
MSTVRWTPPEIPASRWSTDADFTNCDRAEIQEKPAAPAESSLSSSTSRDALVVPATIGRTDDRVAIGGRKPAQGEGA